jgi:4-hydroxy-3-methylbut-2-enyl diphosphate reductase IspH
MLWNSQQVDIILIQSYSVLVLPYCCVVSGEATNTNLMVFDFTCPWFKSTRYHTWSLWFHLSMVQIHKVLHLKSLISPVHGSNPQGTTLEVFDFTCPWFKSTSYYTWSLWFHLSMVQIHKLLHLKSLISPVHGSNPQVTTLEVFDFTCPWFKSTSYHTWSEPVNHYTTNVVLKPTIFTETLMWYKSNY